MKRKLFAALTLAVAVVLAFAAGVSLVAQNGPQSVEKRDAPTFADETFSSPDAFGGPQLKDADPQAVAFIKVATTFAQTAEKEELTRVLDDLQKKVAEIEARTVAAANEKEAARIVNEAQRSLAAAVAKYPNTVAGKRAEKMLNATAEK